LFRTLLFVDDLIVLLIVGPCVLRANVHLQVYWLYC